MRRELDMGGPSGAPGPKPGGEVRPEVEEINDRAAFVALAEEWNALVQQTDDQVFYRHEFIRVWLDNFAHKASWRILTLRDGEGRLEAALPLVLHRARLYGIPVRELCAAANAHSCRFDLLARDPARAAKAFFAHLRARGGWDVLLLTDVPPGGRAHSLLAEAREAGFPIGQWTSQDSPYIPLPGSFEALQQRADAKFRANLRRRRRKLEEKGQVTLQRFEGGEALPALLEEGLLLEAQGWKGRGGTAIAQSLETRGFYGELARTFARLGHLVLSFMRLDGRAVAFHYALEYGGRYLLLKPAYDEAIRECSPGQLLLEDVLKVCVDRRLPEFDFLGPDMPWKRDWTDQTRPHQWLYVFRDNAFGRALWRAKFNWIPKAKERVSRWKR